MAINEHGFSYSKLKWCVAEKAAFTASGLNEITIMTEYRGQAVLAARALGLNISPRGSFFIKKFADIRRKEDG